MAVFINFQKGVAEEGDWKIMSLSGPVPGDRRVMETEATGDIRPQLYLLSIIHE